MNKRLILYILGWVMICEGAAMQLCTVTSIMFRENEGLFFLITGAVCAGLGVLAVKVKKPKNMVLYQKAGFCATALSWILLSLVGALPFFLSGEIPNYIDALFETVSGFTTTGATILVEVERLSHGMLLWRSLMNWLGGMGVIVFLLALIPKLGGQQNIYLMRAESPGPIVGKAVPKMRHYAALLYGIYFGLTLLEFILLICGGMGFFDALNTSFATAGTGGFGIRNTNMAAYDSYYLQTVIAVFIFVIAIYMFALQSRYENTVGNTIANAVSLAISNLPRSLGMAACWIVWAFALIFIGKVAATLAFMLFGLSLPGYICAILYNKVFERLESGNEQQ